MVFDERICTTLNMDHRKRRRKLSREIRKKILNKYVKDKGCLTISKQTDVHVIIQRFKVPWTVANLPGCGRKRKRDDKLTKRII